MALNSFFSQIREHCFLACLVTSRSASSTLFQEKLDHWHWIIDVPDWFFFCCTNVLSSTLLLENSSDLLLENCTIVMSSMWARLPHLPSELRWVGWWYLTLHAYEQQIGRQLSPVPLGLLLVNPVPVESQKVHHDLPAHCVVQGLLQVHPVVGRNPR